MTKLTELTPTNMYAYELLAKLRLLTLAGYENGEYQWLGQKEEWLGLEAEAEKILREYDNKKLCNTK